ncbi:reverse transcriptase [Plasmodiophora brassicae]
MDLIVKLPVSEGYDSVLVVVDRLSKMAHFIPCKESLTAVELSDLFLQQVFRLHGLPDDIVSDRGPQFVSAFWKHLLDRLDIQRNLSSSRHPESDGQTERVNQILEQYLRCYVSYMQDDWMQLLAMAEFAYNNADNSATGMSPFFANYGFHPRVTEPRPRNGQVCNPAADERAEFLGKVRRYLKGQLQQAVDAMKRSADRRRREPPPLQVGDLSTGRPCGKLDDRLLGPFQVVRTVNPVAYEVKLPPTSRLHNVFHVSQLEPYTPNVFPHRLQPPPPPIVLEDDDQPLFIVKSILDSRYR